MATGILDRIKNRVNAFTTDNEKVEDTTYFAPPNGTFGTSFSARPDRQRFGFSNDKSIVTSIYTRLAIDCASVQIKHARLDDQGRYIGDIDSGLNNCLNLEANIDQAAREFRQDIFATLCDEGTIAIIPVDTTLNPDLASSYDILTMRVGIVTQWYPKHVKVSVYNEDIGRRAEIVLPKTVVAIVNNPLYSVMNEPNGTLQRLIRKLNLLDTVDEASASGKLDIIIQVPYTIKSEALKQRANQRRSDIESQLRDGKYGIAYADGTEKITQLNRPAENNLLAQVEYLTTMLYGQLGITAEVMNGTANEEAMLAYWNRTVEPLTNAVVEAIRRTFLTQTARSQKQSVLYFNDVFKLVPVKDLAEIADKLTRNEIISSNEMRQFMGMKPSKDPKADELRNSNMPPTADGTTAASVPSDTATNSDDASSDGGDVDTAMDVLNSQLDSMYSELGVDEKVDDNAA